MSETQGTEDCDNDYCGYANDLNPRDLFIVIWVCLWLTCTSIMFFWLLRNSTISNKNVDANIHNKSSFSNLKSWRLGYVTCIVIYFRELMYVIAWIFWISTFDYAPDSPCFITHVIAHILWAFSGFLLYLFFIHRLYIVYNESENIFGIKIIYYVILLILDSLYFISLIVISASWFWYNNIQYALMNAISLLFEIIMTISISVLFSKPILKVSTMKRKYDETDTKPSYHDDKLLILLTKLTILSGIALGTTTFTRLSIVISYSICREECTLIFVSYATWSIDTFMNIFCILCSFKNMDKYYQKCCSKLQKHILEHIISNVVEKQLYKTDEQINITQQ